MDDDDSGFWLGAAALLTCVFAPSAYASIKKRSRPLRPFVKGSPAAAAVGQRGPSEEKRLRALFEDRVAQLCKASKNCVQYVLLRLFQQMRPLATHGQVNESLVARLTTLRQRYSNGVDEVLAFVLKDGVIASYADDATRRAALFPGSGGLAEFDNPDTKVVARNWAKGAMGYEVCLRSKTELDLNEVEHVVAVLLHEVAHSIHTEYELGSSHGPDFEAINSFLVGFARCEVARAPQSEKQTWMAPDRTHASWALRPFDAEKFNAACKEKEVSFCGTNVSVGACSGACGAGRGAHIKK